MGDKAAKKEAKEWGKMYVDTSSEGPAKIRPKLIRSPEFPEAARECYERMPGNKAGS